MKPGAADLAWRVAWRIGIVAVVLVVALTPRHPITMFFVGQDKVEHFIAFATLTIALGWSLSGWRFWLLAACVGGLAVLIEVLQLLFVHTRSASIKDAVAGLIGVGFGIWAQRWLVQSADRFYNRKQA